MSFRTQYPATVTGYRLPRSSQTRRRADRIAKRAFRPQQDRLEDRTLLATVTWMNPGGGDWDTSANWSTGALPGPSDDVIIDQSGITVIHSSSVPDSVKSLTISPGDSAL